MTRPDDSTVGRGTIDRRRLLQGLSGGVLAVVSGCSAEDILVTTPTSTTTRNASDGRQRAESLQEGVLTVARSESPRGFDPIVVDHVPSRVIFHHIFEGLYEYDRGTTTVPRIARGPPKLSNDGRRWVVELNSDATFQNENPVRADDVKYSFEKPVDEATNVKDEVEIIDRVTAVDDETVQFDLESAYAGFIHTLTHPIVPRDVRERDKTAFNRKKPVGSGPFELVERHKRNYVRLRRWSDYWGRRRPNLKTIEFVTIEDEAKRTNSLANGDTEVVELRTNDLWSTVGDLSGVRIDAVPGITYYHLAFNCKEGPTTDKRVREAVDSLVDFDQLVEEVVEPTGIRQYSPLPRPVAEEWEMPLEEWKALPHERDIATARELFDEAGVPKDYPWRIIVPPDDTREQLARAVTNGLNEAGFTDTTVERLEWGAFLGRYTSGKEADYNMYMLGWRHRPDPDTFTYYLFGRTPEVLGITNGTYYGANSQRGREAARKFARAREIVDRATRRQLYVDGITTVLDDRAHLPVYNIQNSFGLKEHVQDLEVVPTDDRLHVSRGDTDGSTATDTATSNFISVGRSSRE